MYGTQAFLVGRNTAPQFENDVKMYGTQALGKVTRDITWFENDVKMYGTQAVFNPSVCTRSLRMM